jgi:hypothetical protein
VTHASVMPAGKSEIYRVVRLTYDRNLLSWNIYHLACLSANPNRVKFVKYLLKVLPEELTHELMAQTSKEVSNTVQTPSFSLRSCCSLGTVFSL